MRYRYPRHRFPKQNADKLHVTLHGESLIVALAHNSKLVDRLLGLQGEIVLSMTPPREGQDMPNALSGIPKFDYSPFESDNMRNWFSVRCGSTSSLASSGLLLPGLVESIFGYEQRSNSNQKVLRLLKDLEAQEAMSADVFVCQDEDALAFRDKLQDLVTGFILNINEALDYVDVFLKRKNTFISGAHSTIAGKGLYYRERLAELIPAFQKLWITCSTVTTVIPNGLEAQGYLGSLAARMMYMFEAKDRIASQFYLKSDNEVQHEAIRELNYFVTLATGTFDALAWLLRYLSAFRIDEAEENFELRQKVIIRLKPGQTTNALISHAEKYHKELGRYLRSSSVQSLIGVFYPARDSIQHRHPLRGTQYVRAVAQLGAPAIRNEDMDKGFSLAILDRDMEKAISSLDSEDTSDYFSVWGVRKLGDDAFLEPYKFVMQSLRQLSKFYENVFQMLSTKICGSLPQGELHRIREMERQTNKIQSDFLVPFLLQRDLPPISGRLPRLPMPGRLSTGHAQSDISVAYYGIYPLHVESLKEART